MCNAFELFIKLLFITIFIVDFIDHKPQNFIESIPERNRHYCEASISTKYYHGQHNTSYYQPAKDNQHQQYRHDITTQQAPYITYFDRKKVLKHGSIQSRIPSFGIK